MGAAQQTARRRHAWLGFADDSGRSPSAVVGRTWAPRGAPPVLRPVGSNCKRLAVAGALAFRRDGGRARCFVQTHPGSYTDRAPIRFLRALKRHVRHRPVILIGDGLPAHKRRAMRASLARPRAWLTVEQRPGYAPELTPIELVWGNVTRTELANVGADSLDALRGPLRRGCARVPRHPKLVFNFLRHAGLAFGHAR